MGEDTERPLVVTIADTPHHGSVKFQGENLPNVRSVELQSECGEPSVVSLDIVLSDEVKIEHRTDAPESNALDQLKGEE